MPQWMAAEIGSFLSIVGLLVIVREWVYAFRVQGNSLAREDLRTYLRERATDEPTRTANIRRMEQVLPEIEDEGQRELFAGYVAQLATTSQADARRADEIDAAFDVGSPLDEKARRSRRGGLVVLGTVLAIVGTLGQMVGAYPKPFGPFCDTKEWTCPMPAQKSG